MGTGYTRNDTANNIADGNVINAADFDGEYDAIEAAFNSSTGHTHDGTSAEGAPITVLGPSQEFVASSSEVKPSTNAGLDLGTSALKFKDLYIDGVAYIDGFGGDILAATDKKIQFRDTAIFINSSADGQLDIDADTTIELNSPEVIATDDFRLKSDAAILTFGADDDVTVTHVADTGLDAKAASGFALKLQTGDTTVESGNTLGKISFNAPSEASGTDAILVGAEIEAVAEATFDSATNSTALVFKTNTSAAATERMRLSSDGHLKFKDNSKAIFGNGSDLEIYSDGTNSIIAEGTSGGNLIIRGANINFQNEAGTESYAIFADNGAATLYYDNSAKLATTSDGIEVTGTIDADKLTVDSAVSGSPIVTIHNTAGSTSADAGLEVETSTTGTYTQRWVNAGTELARITGAGKFGLGTNSPNAQLHIQAGSVIAPNADADDFVIEKAGDTGLSILSTTTGRIYFGDAASNDQGSIRYVHSDNSMRFETDSTEVMRLDSSGQLGVLTTSPAEALHVTGSARLDGNNSGVTTGDAANQLIFRDNDTTTGGGQPMGDIDFVTQDSGNAGVSGRIRVTAESASTGDGRMTFSTGRVGTLVNNLTMVKTEAAFNQAGADVDFRVESDSSTHMIFVDAGNNKVGINDSSPSGTLHITNTTDTDMAASCAGHLTFEGNGYSGAVAMNGSAMHLFHNSSSRDLIFGTNETERMRITGGGSITLNELGADVDFRVESDSDSYLLFADASGNGTVNIGSAGGNGRLDVISDSNVVDAIRITGSGGNNFIHMVGNQGQTSFKMYENGVTDPAYLEMYDSNAIQHSIQSHSGGGVTFNQQGLPNDFRVESDTQTHQLFVDASVPSTSVGLSSPSYMFEVYHPTSNTVARFQSGDDDVWIAFQATGNTPADHRIGYDSSEDCVTIISGGVEIFRAYPDRVDFPTAASATVSAPAVTFSDSNTGIYDPGADIFSATCGGIHVASFGETAGTPFFTMGQSVKTAVAGTTRKGWSVEEDSAGGDIRHSVSGDNTIYKIYSTQSGAQCGGIVVGGSGTTTTFNTSSDYRLKENVASMTGAIDRLKQLNPVTYDWISSGQSAEGFLAHEAETVVPSSVTGTKDATEEIGILTKGGVVRDDHCTEPASLADDEVWTRTSTEPVYQQIDHSRLVPLLTSALQEAVAKIEALETRVAALENA